MSRWFVASNITPGDNSSLQACPDSGDYTDLQDGDKALVSILNVMTIYVYDSTSALTESLPQVITPDGNAGNGRWILGDIATSGQNGFATSIGPQSDSLATIGVTGTTFTLTHVADYDFYINGVVYRKTGNETVEITDVVGQHVIYFDPEGTLQIQAPGGTVDDIILDNCLVAIVYWDGDAAILLFDERHGNSMSPATHYHLHETLGAQYDDGLSFSNFSVDGTGATADGQFDIVGGTFHDEDNEITIPNDADARIDTFYRLGVGGGWKKSTAAATFPVATGTVATCLDWNDYNGGTWQLQEVTSNNFVLTHYFATNDVLSDSGIIGIMGQDVYSNKSQARTGAETELASLLLGDLPIPEVLPIATVIWQTNSGYANTIKAKVVSTDTGDDYIDWRQSPITGSGSSTVDHESLANLLGGAAADHYHLTLVQHTDLTDGGDCTVHDHDGISENTSHRGSDGKDHSDVGLNNNHRGSAGTDHSDVGLNNTHRTSDGKDHSDVGLNNTHRTSNGSDHTYIDQSVVSGASPVLLGTNFTKAEWTNQQNSAIATLTSSSNAVAWNLSTGQTAKHTLSENTTISAPTNMVDGGTYVLRIIQAAGLYTLSWNAAFDWGEGVASVEPAASGDLIVVTFTSDGSAMKAVEFLREEA